MTKVSTARALARFLVVGSAVRAGSAALADDCLRRLGVGFDSSVAEYSVLERHDEAGARQLHVHPRWRVFGADFQQQLCNRHFTDELLTRRPAGVIVDELTGATLDMVRVAALLGYAVLVRVPREALPAVGSRAYRWLADALSFAKGIYSSADADADRAFGAAFPTLATQVHANAAEAAAAIPSATETDRRFTYAHYAFGLRDHGLLYRMQAPLADHFAGCAEVLELACGPGVFLDILAARGIRSYGVERDRPSVRYARGLGLDVVEADALAHLEGLHEQLDGIYCSHFVEHLDIAALERLIALIAQALRPGGVVLFVFPDPESIRSQLLGFWRDPEHVRFYHPDLIELMCRGQGLDPEFHSQRVDGRSVVPFAYAPPISAQRDLAEPVIATAMAADPGDGWLRRVLSGLGFGGDVALKRQCAAALEQLRLQAEYTARLQRRVDELEGAVRSLWAVNQTWAWDDNAVLRLRKPK